MVGTFSQTLIVFNCSCEHRFFIMMLSMEVFLVINTRINEVVKWECLDGVDVFDYSRSEKP